MGVLNSMLNAWARTIRIGKFGGGDLPHHLAGRIAQHALGAGVKNLDYALLVCGDVGEIDIPKYCILQLFDLDSGVFGHKYIQFSIAGVAPLVG